MERFLAELPGVVADAARRGGGDRAVTEPDEVAGLPGSALPAAGDRSGPAPPDLPVGAVVRVLADDPAAPCDIPAWCRLRDQEFLGSTRLADGATAIDVRRTTQAH